MVTSRDNFKTWRMGLPEDSEAYQELLVYCRELSLQPAETSRVIIAEWAQARRGRMTIGRGMPAFMPAVPAAPLADDQPAHANAKLEQADATTVHFASMIGLDVD
jgi:hypothetical protein